MECKDVTNQWIEDTFDVASLIKKCRTKESVVISLDELTWDDDSFDAVIEKLKSKKEVWRIVTVGLSVL